VFARKPARDIMNKVEQAVSYFGQGYACSQAILTTYGEQYGFDRETSLRIAEGFVGGIAGLGETCGAVVGALMVIGLRYGRTDVSDADARTTTLKAVRNFVDQFKALNSSISCRDLLGCEIDTKEKRRVALEKGLFTTICPDLVRDSAEILETIL